MDTVALVDQLIEDGWKLLERLGEESFEIEAACWVKPFEEDRWRLYIATPLYDEQGPLEAYGKLVDAHRSLGTAWLDSSDVQLVGKNDPLARDALDLLNRFPHVAPIRSPRPLLGRISVEEVFVYPLRSKRIAIYGQTFRGDPTGLLHLSFEPHTTQSWFEQAGSTYPAEADITWTILAPEGAVLQRNEAQELVLSWKMYGRPTELTANNVLTLAELGLHGFRLLHETGEAPAFTIVPPARSAL